MAIFNHFTVLPPEELHIHSGLCKLTRCLCACGKVDPYSVGWKVYIHSQLMLKYGAHDIC